MLDTSKLARELRAGQVFSPEQAERLANAIAQTGDERPLRDVDVRLRDLAIRVGVLTWTVCSLAALILFVLWQLFAVTGEVSANAASTAVRFEAVVRRLDAIEQRLGATAPARQTQAP